MASAHDRWRAALLQKYDADTRALDPPRFGVCVYCGDRSGYGLACGAHLPLLALDPTYADASGRLDETDYLPETDEDGR
jgi:hypothetical protein